MDKLVIKLTEEEKTILEQTGSLSAIKVLKRVGFIKDHEYWFDKLPVLDFNIDNLIASENLKLLDTIVIEIEK